MQDFLSFQDALITASHRGFAFLLVNGVAWFLAGLLARRLAPRRVALLLIVQGFWTIPVSLGLERLLGFSSVAADNPLSNLALLLPLVQSIAIPAVLLTVWSNATLVPAVFSAVVGGHFLPYFWVYRTPVYAVLAVTISVVPLLLTLRRPERSVLYIPLFVGLCLMVSAWLVY